MLPAAHLSYPAEGVGLVIIDSPPKNFGTTELASRITEALEAAQAAGCKVSILASDTAGYFIAHWSLQWIIDAMTSTQTSSSPPPPPPPGQARPPVVFDAIEAMSMIVIAANNGQAWGGGAELSWGCDLRIAAESATYGQPEVALGIIPGAGGTTRLARLIGQTKCMEMILDGRPITAAEALAFGAINRVVPDATLRAESIAWAKHIAQWPAASLIACKRSLIEGRDQPLLDARRNESRIFRDIAGSQDALRVMGAAQAKYDAGADSYEAVGMERR